MTRYLIAADADKIQNFLFRSSHLREVIGGSMLLTDFCNTIKEGHGHNVIISAGGNFKMHFDSQEEALLHMETLAESFRARTGGSLTCAGPQSYQPDQFEEANKVLKQKLLEAKTSRSGYVAAAHIPYAAFCASCGEEIATRYDTTTPELSDTERKSLYLCDSCVSKAQERQIERDKFFHDFRTAVRDIHKSLVNHPLGIPKDPAEDMGKLDPSGYVGYILADGNGIGKLFDECRTDDELSKLSDKLSAAMWSSLAEPMGYLVERLKEQKKSKGWMPIVPLIVGGDDLLALVPARYALDIARRISVAFEKEMGANVTLGLSVVICQKHYPYVLAYERGKQLLDRAKRIGKKLETSSVAFDVVLGNEIVADSQRHSKYQPTLKPYWTGARSDSPELKNYGLPLHLLLEQRLALKDLPGKRLAELRSLFDPVVISSKSFDVATWSRRLKALRERIGMAELTHALTRLGSGNEKDQSIWLTVTRPDTKDPHHAHGLPDLIEVWDYAYKIDVKNSDYQTEAV